MGFPAPLPSYASKVGGMFVWEMPSVQYPPLQDAPEEIVEFEQLGTPAFFFWGGGQTTTTLARGYGKLSGH